MVLCVKTSLGGMDVTREVQAYTHNFLQGCYGTILEKEFCSPLSGTDTESVS